MRILLVHDLFMATGGGSQVVVKIWQKNLQKLKINVKVIGRKNKESINLARLFPNFYITPFTKKLKKEISNFKPDIIHFNEPSFLAFKLLKWAKKNNIRTAVFFHTDYKKATVKKFPLSLLFNQKWGLANKLITLIYRYILNNSDYLLAPSKEWRKKLSHQFQKKVFYVPYPIANYFFKPQKTSPKKISKLITVSRLTGEKRIDTLIKMMPYLKRFTLTIVGDGIDRKYLENQAKKLKVNKRVIFTGWVKHYKLPSLFKKHHLFLSASDFETFGLTYIEALATGLPIVVYNYPVANEVIPPKTGVLVNTYNPQDWALKIKRITNLSQYKQLKNNIIKQYPKIKTYEEKNATLNLVKVYKNILKL